MVSEIYEMNKKIFSPFNNVNKNLKWKCYDSASDF